MGIELIKAATDKHPASQRLLKDKVQILTDWLHSEIVKEVDFTYNYRMPKLHL
jgi:hypothetical protein